MHNHQEHRTIAAKNGDIKIKLVRLIILETFSHDRDVLDKLINTISSDASEKLHQWFATTKSYAYQSKPDLLKEQLLESKLCVSYKLKDIVSMSYYVDDKGLLNACSTSPSNIAGFGIL